ncbi:MAG: hypothetical protein HY552_05815 [Elusimicrobia bacterium]|nr:hypothetical protein [Elusimicrobiota bacterium]
MKAKIIALAVLSGTLSIGTPWAARADENASSRADQPFSPEQTASLKPPIDAAKRLASYSTSIPKKSIVVRKAKNPFLLEIWFADQFKTFTSQRDCSAYPETFRPRANTTLMQLRSNPCIFAINPAPQRMAIGVNRKGDVFYLFVLLSLDKAEVTSGAVLKPAQMREMGLMWEQTEVGRTLPDATREYLWAQVQKAQARKKSS